MSKRQNNFTTPKQSDRLLRVGLPANSADCYYGFDRKEICVRQTKEQWDKKIFEPIYIPERKEPYTCIPCWSVGRLIEIFELCTSSKFERIKTKCSVLTDVLWQIEMYVTETSKGFCIDFSKLEE